MSLGDPRPRALVVAPAFFGYEKDIVAEFDRQGYETTFLDERPSNKAVTRAVLRFRKDLIGRQIQKYYRNKLAEFSDAHFDIVLVIKAEVIPRWFLEGLRQSNPGCRFVFYMWDAISRVRNCLDVVDCFDELFSFDPDDVACRPEFTYLPLFYTNEFALSPSDELSQSRRHILSFVGTLHSERHEFVTKVFAGTPQTFGFFYVQARWYFAVVKYLTRQHSNVPWSDAAFRKLSRQEVANIFRDSVAVLDMPRRGQSGLTIRTFEVLASGSVLVTTNSAITREPFYDPSRVVVVPTDPNEVESADILARLDSTGHSGPPKGFERYSLESWVRTIITPSRREEAPRQ